MPGEKRSRREDITNQDTLKFELERVFRSDAADLLAAHEKARIMHRGHDIRAAGDEVEIAFRNMLRRKLPSRSYVGHGHIVDEQWHQSRQLDVIIADNSGAPILFRAENGSEYFPYESVYAIGEVKSSYDNSEQYIHTFSDMLRGINTQLRRQSYQAAIGGSPRLISPPYGNPLFSFMFFAEKGDFRIEQIRDLYRTRPVGELPLIICILNEGVIANAVSHIQKKSQGELIQPHSISLIPARNSEYEGEPFESHWVLIKHGEDDKSLAANLATFYYPLLQHLQLCQLTPPNLLEYLNHMFDRTTSTVIV